MNVTSVQQLLAAQQMNNALKKSNSSGGNSFGTFLSSALSDANSQTDTNALMESSLYSLAGSSLTAGLSDRGKTNDLLYMFCLMMYGNGANGFGGSDIMMSSLASALSKSTDNSSASVSGMSKGCSGIRNAATNSASVSKISENGLYNGSYVYNTAAKTPLPASPSVAANPQITSSESNRSAGLYRSVIDQFNVETSPRYDVDGGTYCNIFLWDVTRAMGAEIPHYVDADTNEARYYPDVKGTSQQTANRIYDWLDEKGGEYGWYQVTAEEAQNLANEGHPAVTAFKNPGGHGHVQVVCPSEDGKYDPKRGATIAQAGRHLYNYAPITKVYGKSLSKVVYYAHN